MQSLQMIQQLSAAPVLVAIAALPWLAVSLMHAASVSSRAALNDAWNLRADAAVRWARAPLAQAAASSGAVVSFAPRRPSRAARAHQPVLHAA